MTLLVACGAATTVILAAAGWAGAPARQRGARSDGPGLLRRDRLRPGVAVALPVVTAVTFGVGAAAGSVVVAVVARAVVVRRARLRADRLLDEALPELVDLLIVAAAAGQPVPACLASVAERSPVAMRPVLVRADRRVQRGEAVAVALADAGPGLGPLGPTVAEALVAAHRTGTPLRPALERVAAVARDRRRRAAEEAARRLPVTLLFPLVCCVLPAFVLLAVVPLLATSLQSLQP